MISKGDFFQMALRLKAICFIILVWNIIVLDVIEGFGSSGRANSIAETIHGDIYECVDIYKQPSLLHPIPGRERIKISIAKALEKQRLRALQPQKKESLGFKPEEYWLNKKGCPIGTVPIRRMTKKQQQRAKYASLSLANESLPGSIKDFAGISIVPPPQIGRFLGASATMTLYNPHVNGPGQYSAASIYLERGVERIQAGWIVHPELYGDARTRLYTYWTVDNGRITGCYNSICPGYVHTSSEVPIDYAFPKVSFPMFDDCEVGIRIYLDEDYWLQLWFETDVGFWPFNIFKELKNAANIARYGGEVFTPAGEMVSPQMGNGQFLAGLQRSTCHMRQVAYEGDVQEFPPDPSIVTTHQSRCYYEGSENNALDDYWAYNFIFGGEGNCTVPPI